MSPPLVLTIDDDKTTHRFVAKALKSEFELVRAYNGPEGLELATNHKPDIILLDVEMPGMNGYEVCDRLKHDQETTGIPVVFLSSRSSLKERMAGYEVGAIDYLVKPFESDDLNAKIRVIIDFHLQQSQLTQETEEARKTAKIALTSNADLGLIILFVENCFKMSNLQKLGRSMISVTSAMRLNVVVSMEATGETLWFSTSGVTTPLEKEVMTMLKDRDRLNDFGCRTVINYPNVSLMVKNMPLDDQQRYGRIKDLIPAILTSANGKIESINNNQLIHAQSSEIVTAFEKANNTLNELFDLSNQNRKAVENILRTMLDGLQNTIPHMGLDDDQECYILDNIDNSIEQVSETTDSAREIFAAINDVLKDLERLVVHQKAVSDEVASSNDPNEATTDDEEVQSVELF